MPAGRAMVPMLRRRQAESGLQSGLSSTPAPPAACALRKQPAETSPSGQSPVGAGSAQAAAGVELLAGQPAGIVGGQEDGDGRDVLRLADAAQRRLSRGMGVE